MYQLDQAIATLDRVGTFLLVAAGQQEAMRLFFASGP
jgi:hypothetical protein